MKQQNISDELFIQLRGNLINQLRFSLYGLPYYKYQHEYYAFLYHKLYDSIYFNSLGEIL